MAFSCQVTCDCGYQSEIIPYGMTSRFPFEFVIPVYLLKEPELVPCVFRKNDLDMDEESFVEWIDAHAGEVVTEKFGNEAIACGVNSVDFQEIVCPHCRRKTAHVKFIGF